MSVLKNIVSNNTFFLSEVETSNISQGSHVGQSKRLLPPICIYENGTALFFYFSPVIVSKVPLPQTAVLTEIGKMAGDNERTL